MDAEESWLRISRHLHTAQVMRQLQVEKASLNKMVSAYDQMIQRQEAIRETLAEENRNLQRLAYVDGLTQVANRYSFNQTIVRLWKDAYQQGQPVSLLLCDIDYFKRYNDTYGHLQGDRCLHSVAQAIVRGAHRQEDYVARYGGEEFAVLLPSNRLSRGTASRQSRTAGGNERTDTASRFPGAATGQLEHRHLHLNAR